MFRLGGADALLRVGTPALEVLELPAGALDGLLRSTFLPADLRQLARERSTLAAAASQPAATSKPGTRLEALLVKTADRPAMGVTAAAVVIGAAAAFAAASLVCLSGLKGQSLMGAVVGGIACGLVACYVAGAAKVTLHPATAASRSSASNWRLWP